MEFFRPIPAQFQPNFTGFPARKPRTDAGFWVFVYIIPGIPPPMAGAAAAGFFSRFVGCNGFRSQDHGSDGSGILQGRTSHFAGIHDTSFDHVHILFRSSVETGAFGSLLHAFYDYSTFQASIAGDLTNRSFNGAANDIDTGLFVAFGFSFQFVQNRLYLQQSGTAV